MRIISSYNTIKGIPNNRTENLRYINNLATTANNRVNTIYQSSKNIWHSSTKWCKNNFYSLIKSQNKDKDLNIILHAKARAMDESNHAMSYSKEIPSEFANASQSTLFGFAGFVSVFATYFSAKLTYKLQKEQNHLKHFYSDIKSLIQNTQNIQKTIQLDVLKDYVKHNIKEVRTEKLIEGVWACASTLMVIIGKGIKLFVPHLLPIALFSTALQVIVEAGLDIKEIYENYKHLRYINQTLHKDITLLSKQVLCEQKKLLEHKNKLLWSHVASLLGESLGLCLMGALSLGTLGVSIPTGTIGILAPIIIVVSALSALYFNNRLKAKKNCAKIMKKQVNFASFENLSIDNIQHQFLEQNRKVKIAKDYKKILKQNIPYKKRVVLNTKTIAVEILPILSIGLFQNTMLKLTNKHAQHFASQYEISCEQRINTLFEMDSRELISPNLEHINTDKGNLLLYLSSLKKTTACDDISKQIISRLSEKHINPFSLKTKHKFTMREKYNDILQNIDISNIGFIDQLIEKINTNQYSEKQIQKLLKLLKKSIDMYISHQTIHEGGARLNQLNSILTIYQKKNMFKPQKPPQINFDFEKGDFLSKPYIEKINLID